MLKVDDTIFEGYHVTWNKLLIIMTYEKLVYHPEINRVIAFLDTTAGREKLLRTVQYLTRFLAYQSRGDLVELAYLKRIQFLIGISRKPLRFLKFLKHFRSLFIVLDDQLKDKKLRAFDVIKQVGFAAYFFLDGVQWFKQLGLINDRKNKSKLVANAGIYGFRCWLIALTGAILGNLRKLYIIYSRRKALSANSSAPDGKQAGTSMNTATVDLLEKEGSNIAKEQNDLIKNSLDALVAMNGCNIIDATEGTVGLAGFVTSIMGLKDLWKSTKVGV